MEHVGEIVQRWYLRTMRKLSKDQLNRLMEELHRRAEEEYQGRATTKDA